MTNERAGRTGRGRPGQASPRRATAGAPRSARDPLVGTTIGDEYRVLERLGAGTMGAVYLAEQESMHRQVALKVLSKAATDDPVAAARFAREARAASGVNHPSIVQVHAIGRLDGGGAFLVMEYVRGESLGQRLRRGPLEPLLACELSMQLAGALAAAHDAGIVHRDVKPDNILLSRVEGRLVPKLVDFGVARRADATLLTQEGVALGTPNYMAPEQARGAELDARSDIYALGVVLYEMLAGKLPIAAPSLAAQLVAVTRQPPDPFEPALASVLPRGLAPLVLAMLAKKPRERPASMRVVCAELARIIAGDPAASTGGATWPWKAAVVALLAGLTATSWLSRDRLLAGFARLRGARTVVIEELPLGARRLRASADVPPSWATGPQPALEDGRPWRLVVATRSATVDGARRRLRAEAARRLVRELARRAEPAGRTVLAVLLEGESAVAAGHEDALARGDAAAQRRLLEESAARADATAAHLEALLPGVLTLDAWYWQELGEGDRTWIDAVGRFEVQTPAAALAALAATRTLADLGMVLGEPWPGVADTGALVLTTAPDSRAARGGLRPGDVVTRVEGRPVSRLSTLAGLEPMMTSALHSGAGVAFEVQRRGAVRPVTVRLGASRR